MKPKHEFELDDILDALNTLDQKSKMPNISISAYDLHYIPRSHPEELNSISVVDRLNQMENRLEKMQIVLDSNMSENMELKDRVSSLETPSYANVTKLSKPITRVSQSVDCSVPKRVCHVEINRDVPINQTVKAQVSEPSRDPENVIVRPARGISIQTRNIQRYDSTMSLDRGSSSSFQLQPHQRKRQRKQNRVVGNKQPLRGNFTGAPPPQRDIFLYRVNSRATCDDITKHINDENMNVTIHDLKCVSHQQAKFKSFRLKVDINDFTRLLDDSIWPRGVYVRKYISPRNTQNDNDTNINDNASE